MKFAAKNKLVATVMFCFLNTFISKFTLKDVYVNDFHYVSFFTHYFEGRSKKKKKLVTTVLVQRVCSVSSYCCVNKFSLLVFFFF